MKLSRIICMIAAAFLLAGCGKKKAEAPEIQIQEKAPDHKWYYFNSGSYTEVDLPQHSPILSLKPWTESVRICDGNMLEDGTGILLVNRFGVMILDGGSEPRLVQDFQIFSDTTAGNLVFENSVPFFTIAKNSFFNKFAAKDNRAANHVIKLSCGNGIFLPVVTYADLEVDENAEVTGTYYDGQNWFTSIKSTVEDRLYDRYIKWKPAGEMTSMIPVSQKARISISEISKDAYREASRQKEFSKAPVRIRELLSSIPSSFGFTLSLKDPSGTSPRAFYSGTEDSENVANAIITPEWVCAVFGDGTAYFRGSLKGRTLLNKGKNLAFRLPKLPENYIYGNFCISGDYMIISWEESDFYKTGRSGFLVVNMGSIFYE